MPRLEVGVLETVLAGAHVRRLADVAAAEEQPRPFDEHLAPGGVAVPLRAAAIRAPHSGLHGQSSFVFRSGDSATIVHRKRSEKPRFDFTGLQPSTSSEFDEAQFMDAFSESRTAQLPTTVEFGFIIHPRTGPKWLI